MDPCGRHIHKDHSLLCDTALRVLSCISGLSIDGIGPGRTCDILGRHARFLTHAQAQAQAQAGGGGSGGSKNTKPAAFDDVNVNVATSS